MTWVFNNTWGETDVLKEKFRSVCVPVHQKHLPLCLSEGLSHRHATSSLHDD